MVLAREKTASTGHRRELEPQELEPKVAAPIESSPPDRLEETRAATEDPVMSDVPAAQPTTPTRLDVRRTSTKEQLRGSSKERRKSEPTAERGMIDVKITPVKPPERTP